MFSFFKLVSRLGAGELSEPVGFLGFQCLCHLTAQSKEHTQTRDPFWAITMAIITIKRKNNYLNSAKKNNNNVI